PRSLYEVQSESVATELHLAHLLHSGSTTRVKRVPITATRKWTVAEFHRIRDRVLRYVKPEYNTSVNILSIERICNPALDQRLYNAFFQLHKKDCVPELLIHGTYSNSAENIISNGFNVGTQGMFGAGIYFATDTSKSVQYARDNNVKTLLLCEVLLGKTLICTSAQTNLNLQTVQNQGYDSVFARRGTKSTQGVLNDEYIVYRPEQATPRYLVKFTTSTVHGRNELKRTEIKENDGNTAQEYFKVLDRVGRYIRDEHNVSVQILSIEKIENPILDMRLRDISQRMHGRK
uniref:Poly [ADP-ribose] polymerase n=1 Tax=Macrostomum lignano TaxID=282301 RepID=A0A1I8J1C4_9PLAT